MQMQGTLVKYGLNPSHLAFITPAAAGNKHVILVGGQGEGLMYSSYVPPLTEALNAAGWHVVQAQITSSYSGFGCGSLNQDADELLLLCRWLVDQRQASALLLMGHSTGCNDLVRVMQKAAGRWLLPGGIGGSGVDSDTKLPIVGTILQAPCSDCELWQHYPRVDMLIARAQQMVADDKAEQVVFRLPEGTPISGIAITARRLLSVARPGGDDDMFSSGLSDQQLKDILMSVGARPCLILASGADELIPPPYNTRIGEQAARVGSAISTGGHTAQVHVLPGAPHSAEGCEDQLVEHVLSFVKALP